MHRFFPILLICLFAIGCCATGVNTVSKTRSNKKIRVALYADNGTLPICITKSMEILSKDPDISIEKINQKDIVDVKLNNFDVFLLPGGTASGERNSLGKEGCQLISDFNKSGKGVIATCAGAYLVAKGWNAATRDLELVNAEVYDLDNWARGVQDVHCVINTASPKLKEKEFTIHFENGPPLVPADLNQLPSYVSLAKYVTDLHAKDAPAGMMSGKDAIIASTYGKGKVLLFSPHPELTPGLEQLLVKAVHWAANPPKKDDSITWEKVFGTNFIP